MMTDFEIRFDPSGAHTRPPGAKNLVQHLALAATDHGLSQGDAADAHNYICALEARVVALHIQLERALQIAFPPFMTPKEENGPCPPSVRENQS